MNSLGGNSNSGEGGEDWRATAPIKCRVSNNGGLVAFGVTPAYPVNADVIQDCRAGRETGRRGHCRGIKSPGISLNWALFSAGRVTLISRRRRTTIFTYRGLSAAHFRPQTGQPEGDDLREAGVRTGRRQFIATGVAYRR